MVEKGRLKPGSLIQGPALTEPLRLSGVAEEGLVLTLVGSGANTGKAIKLILDPSQLMQLELVDDLRSSNASIAVASAIDFRFYYFSTLLKCRIRYADEEKPFGRLQDIGAASFTPYASAVVLEVRKKSKESILIPWIAVERIGPGEIVIRHEASQAPQADFWIRRDVMDDQVVDVSGAKVVRVNDVHMLHAQGHLILGHVEVGLLGILRRLGIEKAVSGLLRWLLDYNINDKFVSWRHVEVILPGGSPGGVRVSVAPSRLEEMHPAEIADILEKLGVKERQTLFSSLPMETAAETLEELNPEVQRSFLAQQDTGQAADLLQEMPPEEAAAVLRDVPDQEEAQRILSNMESEAAQDVRALLSHQDQSAGSMMSTSCIEARPSETVQATLDRVSAMAKEVEVYSYVYVVDSEKHLLGVLNLRELLRAPPELPVEQLISSNIISVAPDTPIQEVTERLLKYGFRAIPVIDKNNVFLGVVRLMTVLDEMPSLVMR